MQQELREHRVLLLEIATTQRAIAEKNKIVLPENPLSNNNPTSNNSTQILGSTGKLK